MKNLLMILAALIFLFLSCKDPIKENQMRFFEKIVQQQNKDEEVFGNQLLRWDKAHGDLHHIFYKDSLINELYLKVEYRYLKGEIVEIDFEKIRKFIQEPDPTLKELAPNLDSIKIKDGSPNELISEYIKGDYKRRNRYCFYFFSKPIFADNKFCFIYMENFCGPENAGGQVNVYALINGNWEPIGGILTFVS